LTTYLSLIKTNKIPKSTYNLPYPILIKQQFRPKSKFNFEISDKMATYIKFDTLIFNMLTTKANTVILSVARNPLSPQTADSRVFSLRSKWQPTVFPFLSHFMWVADKMVLYDFVGNSILSLNP